MTDTGNPPSYPHFLGSEIEQADPDCGAIHVLPVPYEKTVSYGGGTSNGPSAILAASWQLETWDGHSSPCQHGIHTCAPIDCTPDADRVIADIAAATATIIRHGAFPVVLGGEHTVTGGVLRGLRDAGFDDFGIVQVDAHADLRDAYEGDPLSHASVMKRAADLGIPIYSLGVRAFCEEERDARLAHGVRHLDAAELVPGNVSHLALPDDFPSQVFFTLDIDGMDPSVFPATGTPVPGGLGWYQTLGLFESVAAQRRIIGFDVMEFAPIPGFHAYDFAAALLTYSMLGICERHGHLPD